MKHTITKITVSLTTEQLEFFNRPAEKLGADAGSIILALACSTMQGNPLSDSPEEELAALLWNYVARRAKPMADKGWLESCFAPSTPGETA